MNAVIDNLAKYNEYLVEYDNNSLVVYLSGLDDDGFWWEIDCQTDINSPEDFAQGYQEAMLRKGFIVSFENVTNYDFDN
jgi:hypothetical protein